METPKVNEKKPVKEKKVIPDTGFKMIPVTEMPKRSFFRGSKYYLIVESFLKNPPATGISKVEVPKDTVGNYLASQITKQVKSHKLDNKIKVSCVSGSVYLELIKPDNKVEVKKP